jgi:hypothetical protein
MKKYLIFDAGPLINFSMNGILDLLEKLKREFNGEFVITKEVKKEVIDRPKTIPRFKLGALRLEELYNRGVFKLADLNENEVNELRKIRENLMNSANSMFKTKKRNVHLIDKGEAAALALSQIMKRKINSRENIPLVVDERTTRMLCENPEKLKKLMEKKLHTNIQADPSIYKLFKGFKIIRSTELAYIAHKRNLLNLKDSKLFGATIYGLKFKGCSISEKEAATYGRL